MKLFLYYIASLSLILFIIMGLDKWFAVRNKWRVPETTLFLLAVIGGAPGGTMGMWCFRHKIRKKVFQFGFPLLSILWIGGIIASSHYLL